MRAKSFIIFFCSVVDYESKMKIPYLVSIIDLHVILISFRISFLSLFRVPTNRGSYCVYFILCEPNYKIMIMGHHNFN